jgi:ABC-2 type transport system ATP-binding protein
MAPATNTAMTPRRKRIDVMPIPAIEIENLSHHFGDVAALTGVSLDIQAGEIFGILGPNGGGKTTLFRILATILRPTAGEARVFGHSVVNAPHAVRQSLGVVFQMPSLDVKLTARENLRHQGHLYGLRGRALDQRINDWLARVSLLERAGDITETFSGGMRRRVELAKAMLHEPRLLLMDEPDTGLDPGARRDLWQQIRRLRDEAGVTIAMTTHLMDEADRCDRLAIIHHGRIVAVDTPANLKSAIRGDVITVRPHDDADALREQVADQFGPWSDAAPTVVDGDIRIELPNGPAAVARIGEAFAGKIASITVGRPTLEDVFLHLTGSTLSEEPVEV